MLACQDRLPVEEYAELVCGPTGEDVTSESAPDEITAAVNRIRARWDVNPPRQYERYHAAKLALIDAQIAAATLQEGEEQFDERKFEAEQDWWAMAREISAAERELEENAWLALTRSGCRPAFPSMPPLISTPTPRPTSTPIIPTPTYTPHDEEIRKYANRVCAGEYVIFEQTTFGDIASMHRLRTVQWNIEPPKGLEDWHAANLAQLALSARKIPLYSRHPDELYNYGGESTEAERAEREALYRAEAQAEADMSDRVTSILSRAGCALWAEGSFGVKRRSW